MPPATSRVQRFSLLLVLACVGTLLVITACGFIPPPRPLPKPETFILLESSGRLLGHGTLLMSNSVRTRAEVVLYRQSGPPDPSVPPLSAVDLQGLLVLTLPRRLVLHGTSGSTTVSISATSPNPFTGDGDSELLPFTGKLKLDEPTASQQTLVSAQAYSPDRFLLHLPAAGANGQPAGFTLNLTLWPGDTPGTRHILAELDAKTLCRDPARNDESLSTQVDGPFTLDLRTTQGATAHLQLTLPLAQLRAQPATLQGSLTFTGGPCSGQRFTLDGARF